jgi:hypothetical protein
MQQPVIHYPPTKLLDNYWKEESKKHPDLARLVLPRRIQPPYGYLNPQHYATTSMAMLQSPGRTDSDQTLVWTWLMVRQLLLEGMPTFFIDRDFMRAVIDTEPPDCQISDIKWPYSAMLFVLPLDVIFDFTGGWAFPFISVAHSIPGQYTMREFNVTSLDIGREVIRNGIDRFIFHFPAYVRNDIPVDYVASFEMTSHISKMAKLGEFLEYREGSAAQRFGKLNGDNPLSKEEELEINRRMNSLTAKLMLAITSNPHFIEKGERLWPKNPVKPGQVLDKPELYSPNFLGRKYTKTVYAGSTPSQPTSKILPRHRRKGHWTWTVRGSRENFVSVNDLKRNEEGFIDWEITPKDIVEKFHASHYLDWIYPLWVNDHAAAA